MKFLRYGPKGHEKPGLLDKSGALRDLSDNISDIDGAAVLPRQLDVLKALDPDDLPLVKGEPRIGACVGNVGKIICIGLNYSDHAEEAGMAVPSEPVMFFKATSAICGAYDDLELPRGSVSTDWEVELGIVIGQPGKYIDEKDALDHVAGYCTVNDVSERDFQIKREGQWMKGKSADTFAPIGPWFVTRDEITDPQNVPLYLEVNGHRYQDGSTKTMVFSVPRIVSYVSQFMSLQAGDIISTGTPPGVGMGQKPPVYLKEGDVIEACVEGLGFQRQKVVQG